MTDKNNDYYYWIGAGCPDENHWYKQEDVVKYRCRYRKDNKSDLWANKGNYIKNKLKYICKK